MDNLMIKIENVSKMYRLGQIGGTTLREELQRKKARLLHKNDPTIKIGENSAHIGEPFLALNGISFEVKSGERVGIIGHNGAGKSTLLKLITRITAPTEGMIGLNGRVASMLEVGTGFNGELTGRENIYMNGAILGMNKKEIDSKIEDIVEFSECRQFIDTPVKRYSSGMYVKLAFAVAAHLNSEIMIMDEVLAVGDAKFQQKCIARMREESIDNGKTVLYVSHNMETIRQLCQRCVVLNHGKLEFDGDVEKAINIYIGLSELQIQDKYDLRQCKRPKTIVGGDVKLQELCILNQQQNIYSNNEKIKFEVIFESRKEFDNACFMVVYLLRDETRMGMTHSQNFKISIGKNRVVCEAPLFGFINGEYKVELGILEIKSDGTSVRQDSCWDAFAFKIFSKKMESEFGKWDRGIWGNYYAPQVEVYQ